MNCLAFDFMGASLIARPSGALYWPAADMLCVSDLHLGKSERLARRAGTLLPPYETRETLARLDADIQATGARIILCLGDSFDDPQAADALDEEATFWLTRLMAGRHWIWVEGNHDPGVLGFGGSYVANYRADPITFRHIAETGAVGEISGHYHPKVTLATRGRAISRPCFLCDDQRLILPAYGTYTGGLRTTDPALSSLMQADARAFMLGKSVQAVPMPRSQTVNVS